MKIQGKKKLIGELTVPGDKSISHRAVILGSIANGKTIIKNPLLCEDTISTIEIFRKMGIPISLDKENNKLTILGQGLYGLKPPKEFLNCNNSGTTMRLISGILIGQNFSSEIIGDESLNKRPMDRIIKPLSLMGGVISGIKDKFPPLKIKPCENLEGISYNMPIASAQVKSCILLASLYSKGNTRIIQNKISRDHTERMLEYFGSDISYSKGEIIMNNNVELVGKEIFVPGDISSAAFFIVGGSIIEGSNITIKDVGLNETRTGIVKVLKDMGANIVIDNIRVMNNEAFGDIIVKYSPLKGVEINGEIIGTLIDELPIIAVAAAFAKGKTVVRNAEELKHKESDRIKAIVNELRKMDVDIEELPDGFVVNGKEKLMPNILNSHNDHRIAMALSIASLNVDGISEIVNSSCIDISYPEFYQDLGQLLY